jgi:DNA-binding beta-propeller fold protein YncE
VGLALSSGYIDGVGSNSRFNEPSYLAITPDGLYALIADWSNNAVRRVEIRTGDVTTLVGGTSGSNDGFGTGAQFSNPVGIAISPDGFFALVTEYGNSVIRKVVLGTGAVTTLAGAKGVAGFSDGRGTVSRFNYPEGIAISPDGWFAVVTDKGEHSIRFIALATGDVTTVAGSTSGLADGVGLAAQFNIPAGIAVKPPDVPHRGLPGLVQPLPKRLLQGKLHLGIGGLLRRVRRVLRWPVSLGLRGRLARDLPLCREPRGVSPHPAGWPVVPVRPP